MIMLLLSNLEVGKSSPKYSESRTYLCLFWRIGNSNLRQSRAKVLGGCSSHNGCVSLHTFEHDCQRFRDAGCTDWTFQTFKRMIEKTRLTYQVVDKSRENALLTDWIKAASATFNVPILEDINKVTSKGNISGGTGYMPISYDVASGDRVSASTSYIHPILRGERSLSNLKILINSWVSRINVSDNAVTGVTILQDGHELNLYHKAETILCAGAIDTPRLMLLSGIGPKDQLSSLSIPLQKDIPGVGENLQDHVETNVIWDLKRPAPSETVTFSDVFLYLRREEANLSDSDGDTADVMFHCYTAPHLPNIDQLGALPPKFPLVMMPNIPRPRSRGRLYLTSADPKIHPALDFRYFTDAEGYDETTLLEGLKMCRTLAQSSPLKDWIAREVAPGREVVSDEDLSEYARKSSTTLFHPCGSTKMGNLENDPLAVVDTRFRVRGLKGLRIVDAGVLPVITSTNPMLTVFAVSEHAAEVIANESKSGPFAHEQLTKRNSRL